MRHVLSFGFLAIAVAAACHGRNAALPFGTPANGTDDPAGRSGTTNGDSTTAVEARAPQEKTAAPTTTSLYEDAPTEARIDFLGRFDWRDREGPRCGFPGCRVVARFEGANVAARLSESADSWMLGGPSEWDVTIDGVSQPKLVLNLGANEYTLATDLPRGEHVVELYKRSEAQNGTTQFLGYDFGDGKLLPPPPRLRRKIEMIGDSQPAGFGIEGVSQYPECPGLDYAARWQNFHRSMGTLLASALSADVNGTVYSGKGIVKDIYRPDTETMPKLFGRALPVDPNSLWDFSSYVPDVVVIMIGGNDFAIGQPFDDGPATQAAFSDGYHAFVADIRSRYPLAHVFLATSPSTYDEVPAGRNTRTNIIAGIANVVSRRSAVGDTKVYAVTPPIAAPEELTGCGGHGNPEYHQRVANDLAPVIREKTGW